jgi:hypothetical protein
MKQTYLNKNFNAASLAVIDQANEIIEEYQGAGFDLTLRQLYYQFVARAMIPNTQQSYKRLGKIISNARLAGMVDWDAIVDRTRQLKANGHWSSVGNIIYSCAFGYRRDVWANQPTRIEVWIEKEALIGVIEKPCEELDIPFFACRGYVSQSELRVAGVRAREHYDRGQQTVIIHLGDHDPSGMDMTRDNDDRMDLFSESSFAEIRRIALNMDQVERYNPPPNPAKTTDSRSDEYILRYGEDSWELDALEPQVMDRLIRNEVATIIDQDLMDEAIAEQEADRAILNKLAEEYQ